MPCTGLFPKAKKRPEEGGGGSPPVARHFNTSQHDQRLGLCAIVVAVPPPPRPIDRPQAPHAPLSTGAMGRGD